MGKVLVAAYGTLRKGFGNSRLVDFGNNHVGTGKTVDKYQLRANGIPYVNKTPDTQIVVDVWEIDEHDDLPDVDNLEGYDPDDEDNSWYKRELIDVDIEGKVKQAWLYFMNSSAEIVPSGDYKIYINESKYK